MRDTIKKHEDFFMRPTDPVAHSSYFLVRAKQAKIQNDARYGITVTKKTFKHAVDRNRAKRMLRDWIQFNEKLMRDDLDYVFIVRRGIMDATREEGRAAMARALCYIKKQKSDA